MSKIDETTVKHVAKLARIAITDEEVEKYSHDLSEILGYVEQLGKVDVKDVEPLAQISGLKNVFREDEVTNSPMTKALLANAPMTKDGFIKVKAVKDES